MTAELRSARIEPDQELQAEMLDLRTATADQLARRRLKVMFGDGDQGEPAKASTAPADRAFSSRPIVIRERLLP